MYLLSKIVELIWPSDSIEECPHLLLKHQTMTSSTSQHASSFSANRGSSSNISSVSSGVGVGSVMNHSASNPNISMSDFYITPPVRTSDSHTKC